MDYGDKDELHACKINTYMVNKECVALADEFESCHAKVQSYEITLAKKISLGCFSVRVPKYYKNASRSLNLDWSGDLHWRPVSGKRARSSNLANVTPPTLMES